MFTHHSIRTFSLTIFVLLVLALPSYACEMCIIPQLGKNQGVVVDSKDKKWEFKYLFEYQNWHSKESGEAHSLHHQGHHFHDKNYEFFHHFGLEGKVTDDLTVAFDIPYVIRHLTEIDDHDILGSKEKSEGWGDLLTTARYRIFYENNQSVYAVIGVKFPTGATDKSNSVGTRFEQEMQPGSGSFDYVLGGVYQNQFGRWNTVGNLAYVFKTEGKDNFEYGDLVSASVLIDYAVNPDAADWKARLGVDASFQYEMKQKDNGSKITDSGGTTVLLGPAFNVSANKSVSFYGNVLFPVYQNLGGVHQELDFTSILGVKIDW